MKKWILIAGLPIILFACNPKEDTAEDTFVPPVKEEVVKHYPDGKIRIKGMLYDGKRHGKWTYYYDNGFLWSEGMFHYGKRDGYSLLFYKNGRKMVSGEYENDKAVGEWYFYTEDGMLDTTINAENNLEEIEKQLRNLAQVIAG